MSPNKDLLLKHLQNTSRSFYLGIVQLKGDLQIDICLGYLLCRIFDCFEDATSVDAGLRKNRLEALLKLFSTLGDDGFNRSEFEREIKAWQQGLELENQWSSFQKSHLKDFQLLVDSELVLGAIARFEKSKRDVFVDTLSPMAKGMIQEIETRQIQKNLSSRSLEEFHEYCYWVAGTVGEFLTRLFVLEGVFKTSEISDAELMHSGRYFGRALQIVNIAKDFFKDWQEGRCFWPLISLPIEASTPKPSREKLENSFEILVSEFEKTKPHIEKYLTTLKESRSDVRFFCSFPYRMAIETLKEGVSDREWLSKGTEFKVSRVKTLAIMASTQ